MHPSLFEILRTCCKKVWFEEASVIFLIDTILSLHTGWTESNFTFSFAYNFFIIWDRPLHPLMKKCSYGRTFWFLQSWFFVKFLRFEPTTSLLVQYFYSKVGPITPNLWVRILPKPKHLSIDFSKCSTIRTLFHQKR